MVHKYLQYIILSITVFACYTPYSAHADNIYLLAMNANVGGLKYTDRDRRKIVNSFKSVYGTDRLTVYSINNVTRKRYTQAMKMLKVAVKRNDHLVIYFSGHGTIVPDKNGDERDGFDEALVGYSPSGKIQHSQVILDDMLVRDIRKIRPKKLTVILDTCYSGGMRKALAESGLTSKFIFIPPDNPARSDISSDMQSLLYRGSAKGLLDGTKGILYAASAEHQDAYEFNKKNLKGGVFTQTFSRALRRTKNLNKAFSIANRKVKRRTNKKQTPQKYRY